LNIVCIVFVTASSFSELRFHARRSDTKNFPPEGGERAMELLDRTISSLPPGDGTSDERAKGTATSCAIVTSQEEGISESDLRLSLEADYEENDIFPPTDITEDWLNLIDYDSEKLVKISSFGPDRRSTQARLTRSTARYSTSSLFCQRLLIAHVGSRMFIRYISAHPWRGPATSIPESEEGNLCRSFITASCRGWSFASASSR
jgi:hypothetical protein